MLGNIIIGAVLLAVISWAGFRSYRNMKNNRCPGCGGCGFASRNECPSHESSRIN
ncbi:MAG TPA: FeoB-associated Cys-rich membrane protein [Firmicutes bacterium]|nr:FeoB-associated Cys-rich membrane protein [Bacillota bacterium]